LLANPVPDPPATSVKWRKNSGGLLILAMGISTRLHDFQTNRKGTCGVDAKRVYNARGANAGCEEDYA